MPRERVRQFHLAGHTNKGSHIIEIDRFLRATVRDIGWGFFYGWIFFDDVFGTTNHYGTVDVFAGSYDRGCKEAGIDASFGYHHFAHANNQLVSGDYIAGFSGKSMAEKNKEREAGKA